MFPPGNRTFIPPAALAAASLILFALQLCPQYAGAQSVRDRFKARSEQTNQSASQTDFLRLSIAGLKVAVWEPAQTPAPLVVFSHGFHGVNVQTLFLMHALKKHGYLVIAPNHQDAIGGGGTFARPEQPFAKVQDWSDRTFAQRGDDVKHLLAALHEDPSWSHKIDWTRIALAGHSLGGYTALALAGAWPSWKVPGVKAVLALSPYCLPFLENNTLTSLDVPVMYQGGTLDIGITPSIKGPRGAFSQTGAPALFVEFKGAGHFAWTNLNKKPVQQDLIDYYSVAFFDRYVKGDLSADLSQWRPGVSMLKSK